MYVILLSLIGGINPSLGKLRSNPTGYMLGWALRSLIALPFAWLFWYFYLPAQVGPFAGFGWPLLVAWIVNFGLSIFIWISSSEDSRYGERKPQAAAPVGAALIAVLLVVAGFISVRSSEMFNAEHYKNMLG